MRKTLLVSACIMGFGLSAPAFAQTERGADVPGASGGTSSGMTGSMGTTSVPGTTPGTGMSNEGSSGSSMRAAPRRHHRHHNRTRHHDRQSMTGGTGSYDQGMDSSTGARPGHEPGVGMSEPMSTGASNVDASTTRSEIAPRLPTPSVGSGASARQYLNAAQRAVQARRTGEAQEALERAETRALDSSVAPSQAGEPNTSPMVTQIKAAREALARRDMEGANRAISEAMNAPGPNAGNNGRMGMDDSMGGNMSHHGRRMHGHGMRGHGMDQQMGADRTFNGTSSGQFGNTMGDPSRTARHGTAGQGLMDSNRDMNQGSMSGSNMSGSNMGGSNMGAGGMDTPTGMRGQPGGATMGGQPSGPGTGAGNTQ